MAADSKVKVLKSVRQRRYLNRDFISLKQNLLDDARRFYPDNLQDFSEVGLGGMLLDFGAAVGDNLNFYLDHLFGELFSDTAVEDDNIEHHIRQAGVELVGATPAVVSESFLIEVPAEKQGSTWIPRQDALPRVLEGSVVSSDNGTDFALTEDIDFSERNSRGEFKATVSIGQVNSDGSPRTFRLTSEEIMISGKVSSETFSISSNFVPFRQITLQNSDITEIISVVDSSGNYYYEVDDLSNDTIFRRVPNLNDDNELVKEVLELIPAPFRFTRSINPSTRITTLVFGGGSADTLDDDIIPDPSEFAIPLYGKKTFSRFSLDPNRLLSTRTLGVAAINTTLTITYRHGGGLQHNAEPGSVENITSLRMTFPRNPPADIASSVRSSTAATNLLRASGGDDAPTLEDLRAAIPAARNAQKRVVSKEDLLARVYTLPSNFGRVFRAGALPNPNNPLAGQLFILSRNIDGNLIACPDTLKRNLRIYLNNLRLINDAIDILDGKVINFKLEFEIVADPDMNKSIIIQNIIVKLRDYLNIKNFQIGQPLVLSDINNIIFNTPGVLSINTISIKNLSQIVDNRIYSDTSFDVKSNTIKGFILPPPGGIFQCRFPDFDIVGAAI